jgi:predicted transcriptional regulator
MILSSFPEDLRRKRFIAQDDAPLSDLAIEILNAMEESGDGMLIIVFGDEQHVLVAQTVAKSFGSNEPRERAEMEAAITELIKRGFIDKAGKKAYKITDKSYKMLDMLNNHAPDA